MKKTNGAEQHQRDLAETLPDLAKDRWEEAVAYDLTVETQLANAQSNRSRAEVERQRVAGEILEATREICHEIASDARKALDSAKYMEIDATRKHLEAEAALKSAESTLKEADANAFLTPLSLSPNRPNLLVTPIKIAFAKKFLAAACPGAWFMPG